MEGQQEGKQLGRIPILEERLDQPVLGEGFAGALQNSP